jgi:hypothetical protein
MRKDKDLAINLRKEGKSYNEIRSILGVPIATLSDWFSQKEWSNDIAQDLGKRIAFSNKSQRLKAHSVRMGKIAVRYIETERQAVAEFALYKENPLFISGLMLYWGEGNKSSKYNISLANTDAKMIKIFYRFLTTFLYSDTKRISGWILAYPDMDLEQTKQFWVMSTGLSPEQFNKTTVIIGKHKTRKLTNGVCTITISSAYLKCKLTKWIELLTEELVHEGDLHTKK